ncbi:hypothetical protein LTS18_011951, partial [Coniosporium uncinatum]
MAATVASVARNCRKVRTQTPASDETHASFTGALPPRGPVMCIGRNYADHIRELNSAKPKQPFFFLKPPSSILLPGAGPVQRPRGVIMHYEVELGLIMGKTLRDHDPEDVEGA